MRRGQGFVTSKCESILCSKKNIFKNIAIREPRHFGSDHFLLLGILRSASKRMHRSYSQGRKRFRLNPSKWGPKTKEDFLFQEIKGFIVPRSKQAQKWNSWISDKTWRLIGCKAGLSQSFIYSHTEDICLHRLIQRAIKADRKKITEDAGKSIDDLLSQNKLQEAWIILQE
jgi:hypothetical protein